jgi:hypothetical protein
MKVPLSFEMSSTIHPAAQHHILEDFNLYGSTTLEYLRYVKNEKFGLLPVHLCV